MSCHIWKTHLENAIRCVQADPCIALNKIAGKVVHQMKDNLMNCSEDNLKNAKLLVEKVESCILFDRKKKVTKHAIDDMVRAFQAAIHGDGYFQPFTAMLFELNVNTDEDTLDLIYWLFMRSLLNVLIKTTMLPQTQVHLDVENINATMTETELQVLRYVAGFIVKKLKKHMKQHLQEVLKKLVDSSEDGEEPNHFLAYTRKLVESHDRGGLINVNDKLFVLLIGFEKIAKTVLTHEGTDMPEQMTTAIRDSYQLNLLWDQIVKDETTEHDKDALYYTIITYFVTLRMKSYANAHKFLLDKRESAKQRKSLRHDLN